MNPHPQTLDQLIADTREAHSKAEREEHDLRIKLDALLEAKALTLNQPVNATDRPQAHAGNGRARRRRSISASWKQVLRKMDQRGESDYDAILAYCSEAGIEIERRSLRGQMFGYVNRHHFLVSPHEGVFRVTPEGRKAAGIPWNGGDASANSTEAP
jgi:hypothetical protein